MRLSSSEAMIMIGMVALVISLVDRYTGNMSNLTFFFSWIGSILVIIGTGKMFFLD
jgi:hypothetical protein